MNVMFVSQCSKRALKETRRVLDQFAERKGDRTWQTPITQQGLATVRKMLRKSAKRNTAVACHWIKSANRTELLWIVGSIGKFNEQGTVPTNTTRRDILRAKDENLWHTVEDISLLAGIAGLFHDFGKANYLFQKKLEGKGKTYEPYRHEWISVRLFQAFIGNLTDREWLEKLNSVNGDDDELLAGLKADGLGKTENPLAAMPPFARAVAWLILAHHRLPVWIGKKDQSGAPGLNNIDKWLCGKVLTPAWNSPQCVNREWEINDIKSVWQFKFNTPVQSRTWKSKAYSLSKRALKRPDIISGETEWMDDIFTVHLARMVLMLFDHYYSAADATPAWQDKKYKAYANTDSFTRKRKQKLDEHIIGVGHNAVLLAKSLPTIRRGLPAISRHKALKRRGTDSRFRWQDKAYELARNIQRRSADHGFFGVNMASTGCGKTFANARIMYGLSSEKTGCRFSVALGLRTLTLQTGDALRGRMHLEDDDLAVLIGSQAVKQLHELNKQESHQSGSEAAEPFFDEDQYLIYEGGLGDGRLKKWLEKTPKLNQLVSAPVLVCTIDHLVPATESARGGRQIAPMLRLLTSDLVLDEPDDFDLNDLPALCRLVHWAGMLGSRVLISSATLPPSLTEALFDAYLSGRRLYQDSCGEPGRSLKVCCAWFDENKAVQGDHTDTRAFAEQHKSFVQKRLDRLMKEKPLRRAEIVSVSADEATPKAAVSAIGQAVHQAMHKLHDAHSRNHPDSAKRVSVGLVRMANIKPLVAVARHLMTCPPLSNYRVHYCVYHSQHPLAVRSKIEQRLDSILTRHDPDAIWSHPDIKQALEKYPEANHMFVVLSTSVAEKSGVTMIMTGPLPSQAQCVRLSSWQAAYKDIGKLLLTRLTFLFFPKIIRH